MDNFGKLIDECRLVGKKSGEKLVEDVKKPFTYEILYDEDFDPSSLTNDELQEAYIHLRGDVYTRGLDVFTQDEFEILKDNLKLVSREALKRGVELEESKESKLTEQPKESKTKEGKIPSDSDSEQTKIDKLTEDNLVDILREQDEEEEEIPAEEEPIVKPPEEKEEEVPEITKEYMGKTEDTHFYLISTETDGGEVEDIQVVDQEGVKKFSAKDNNLDLADVTEVVIRAIEELKMEDIAWDIFARYILPKLKEEEEEPEEEEEEELKKEKRPPKEKPEEELEEEPPVESKTKEGKIPSDQDSEQTKINKLLEMKVTDDEGNTFEVNLVDDGTEDTVVNINGQEFRFDKDFASMWRDEEGVLSEEGLQELALDALANLEEEDYNELLAKYEEFVKEPPRKKEEEVPESKSEEEKDMKDKKTKEGKVPSDSDSEQTKIDKLLEADVSKGVKELIKMTKAALADGDYVKAADLCSKLAQIQQTVPPDAEAKAEEEEPEKEKPEEEKEKPEEKEEEVEEDTMTEEELSDDELQQVYDDIFDGKTTIEEAGEKGRPLKKGAAVRSRGDCVFQSTHPKVKDNKDHFPVNSENQARNALARANQYDSAPDWYKGSLQSLINSVVRKVHSKYPSIEITKAAKKPGKESKIKVEDEKQSLDEKRSEDCLKTLLGLDD